MNRSAILNFKKIHIFKHLKNNSLLLVLCILFTLGLLIGTLLYNKSLPLQNISESLFEGFIKKRQGTSFFSKLTASALSSFICLLIAFISGTSLMGSVLVPSFIGCCGLGYGAVSSLLYSKYALEGIAFNGLLIMPSVLLIMICLMLAGREAMSFSAVISRLMLPKSRPMNLSYDFKNYCGRYLILSIAVILVSLVDAILSTSFLRFFSF